MKTDKPSKRKISDRDAELIDDIRQALGKKTSNGPGLLRFELAVADVVLERERRNRG